MRNVAVAKTHEEAMETARQGWPSGRIGRANSVFSKPCG